MTTRYDRTICVVMWLDAFLSIAMVVLCVVAAPVVATLGVPAGLRAAVALAAIGLAVLLAAFGAVTAVLLMLRMRAGQHLLPPTLWLPLPALMRPRLATPASSRPTRASGSRS